MKMLTELKPYLWALVVVLSSSGASSAGSSWKGTINCSYGSGALNIQIDDNGRVSGGMTNGKIRSGTLSGSSITFTFSNAFGNGGVFSGRVAGSTMSGTYTQSAGTAETCSWQAALSGNTRTAGSSKKKEKEPIDQNCPVSIRHKVRATYYAANPCKGTSILVVMDTIDPDRTCSRSYETIMRSESTHLLYSHFATAPRKVFQCNLLMSNGKKNPQCNVRALTAKYGKSC
jgi:hypothetical protein